VTPDDNILCERAGIWMSKAEWFLLPLAMRQRYWQETDYGNESTAISIELVQIIRDELKSLRDAAV
jgi:hypothetical protein